MKKEFDFEKSGKKLPYPVPEDFFRNITEKTLKKAKERQQKAKFRKLVFTAAASVLIAVAIGFSVIVSRQNKTEVAESIQPEPKIENNTVQRGSNINTNNSTDQAAKNTVTEKPETLDKLIANMSDQELNELAEVLSVEIFMDDLNSEVE